MTLCACFVNDWSPVRRHHFIVNINMFAEPVTPGSTDRSRLDKVPVIKSLINHFTWMSPHNMHMGNNLFVQ